MHTFHALPTLQWTTEGTKHLSLAGIAKPPKLARPVMIVMGGQTMSKPDLVYKCPRLSSRFPQGSGGTAFKSNDSVFFSKSRILKKSKNKWRQWKGQSVSKIFQDQFNFAKAQVMSGRPVWWRVAPSRVPSTPGSRPWLLPSGLSSCRW